jgi:maltooligosyltrehalose trehalohydrolase
LKIKRNFPVGAEVTTEGVHFRVWAPEKESIDVVFFDKNTKELLSDSLHKLDKESSGYFSGNVKNVVPGDLYKFRINGINDYYPDPASRYQPFGPHGPSEIIDQNAFKWEDNDWKGIDPENLIIYEMHLGTFTSDGTYKSTIEKLQYLADTGINMIELMPVSEFPGKFGWGYDGVGLFSPSRLYGRPDDLKLFINSAHLLGIGVILDVVYNHLGPDGNYLSKYSDHYFSKKYKTDWGAAINYDDKNSNAVREYFKSNAAYWITEFHMDGLRLDATQDIFDSSETHILSEINDVVRQSGGKRTTYIVTENEPQNSTLVRDRKQGGYGFDAMWNDDFHHSAMVALTGKNEAYYTDYLGNPQEFISALKYGFLYQGQYYKWQKKKRGRTSLDILPGNLINFIQNHDQIANSGRGIRIHKLTSPSRFRAMTALLFLSPQTPMLFQGQEFGSSSPFLYFADHNPELAEAVGKGRFQFLQQFRSMATEEMREVLSDPDKLESFVKSKLDFSEVEKHAGIYKLHKDLISLRKSDPRFKMNRIDGAVLGHSSFVIRYFYKNNDALLIVNFGIDLELKPAPEPLLAPLDGMEWEILWSSEHPSYGGGGTALPDTGEGWIIPGETAVVLTGKKTEEQNG